MENKILNKEKIINAKIIKIIIINKLKKKKKEKNYNVILRYCPGKDQQKCCKIYINQKWASSPQET